MFTSQDFVTKLRVQEGFVAFDQYVLQTLEPVLAKWLKNAFTANPTLLLWGFRGSGADGNVGAESR